MRRRIGLVLTVVIGVVGSTLSVSAGVVRAEPSDTEEGPELVTPAVTQEACVQGGACHATIQGAVDAAPSGGTVTVSAGTFNESVQIDKPLTLLGPNSGLPFNPLTTTNRLPEATLLAPSAVLPAIKVVTNIGAVTVSGVTVTSPSGISLTTTIKLIEVVAPGNSFTLKNSLVDLGNDDQCGSALYSNGANEIRISGNLFVDGDYPSACEPAPGYESRTLYISSSPLASVEGNIFERTGHSIFLEAMPSGTTRPQVSGNEFRSGRQHITVGKTGSGLDISGNTFRQGNGMYFDSSTNVSIKNNDLTVQQNGSSLWIYNTDASTFEVDRNAFRGPGYASGYGATFAGKAIFHRASGHIDLSGNWWDVNRPGGTVGLGDQPSRTFTALPAITAYLNDQEKLGLPGFWPTALVNTTAPSQRPGTVTLSAQLDSVAGSQVSFTVNGVNRGTATIDGSGRATVSAVLEPGSYRVAVSSTGETSPDPVTLNVFSRTVCQIGCDHVTIQAAIDAASPNDTIAVSAGTYAGPVTINRNGIMLQPITSGEVTISGKITINADSVTVRGMKVIASSCGTTGALLVGADGSSPTIQGNEIIGPGPGDSSCGIGIELFNSWSGNGLIDNNVIRGFTTGMQLQGTTAESVVVSNNRILHVGASGTSIALNIGIRNVQIIDNEFIGTSSNPSRNGVSMADNVDQVIIRGNRATGLTGTAVNLRGSRVSVIDNQFTQNLIGVTFPSSSTSSAVTSARIRNNDLSGNTSGLLLVSTAPTGLLDASRNYWGIQAPTVSAGTTASGPTVVDQRSGATDQVIVSPYLDGPNGSPVLPAGTITGQVRDSSGVGVSGVQVSAGSIQVTTDGLGRYELTGLTGDQSYTVSISATPKAGFIPAGPTTRVVFLATGQAATADFQIAPTASITGRVTDLSGTGVSGVTVNVGQSLTTTNADGRYSFTGLTTNQAYTVTISASGSGLPSGYVSAGPTTRQVFLAASGATGADFMVTRTLSVLARVVDSLGSPIVGASVTIGEAIQTTGVNGTTSRTVTSGSITVSTQALSGYVIVGPSSTQVNVSSGSSATVTFVMAATSSITGRVVDTVGVGVAGVTVTLSGAGTGSTTSRSDGTYQFIGLTSTGPHSVTITVPGGFVASGATRRAVNLASGGSATAAFVLAEQGAITGRVIDDIGAGIAGVTVTLSTNPTRTTTTGLDGRYRFGDLTVGQNIQVTVGSPADFVEPTGRTSRLVQSVGVGSTSLDVVLLPPGVVSGFAFLDFDGDGVRSDGEPTLGGIGMTLLPSGRTTITSATGYYQFDQAQQGSTVTLGTTGSFVSLTETVAGPTVITVATIRPQNGGLTQFLQDFPLLPPGVIAGAVLLPDGSPVGGVTIGGIANKSGIVTSADGTFYVSDVANGTFNVSATPPTGFFATANSSRSVTLSDAARSATALLELADTNEGGQETNPVTPTPPAGEVLGPSVRVPAGNLRTPVVRADTTYGLVELSFEGLVATRRDGSIVVTPVLPFDNSDRGVVSVGTRFRITADGARFASVEVCLPVDAAAFRALRTDVSRLRLVHRLTNGTEVDITGRIDLSSSPAQVCGVTTSFSDFQVVVLTTERIAGSDRYATAAEVALDMYPSGASTVYVANGDQHSDALVAGLAAAENGAPLLLVRTSMIPDATKRALASLKPSRVVIIGGELAVAANVATELGSLTSARITRIAGTDRFDTAARLATTQFPTGVDTVYVASGLGFADALAAGVVAGFDDAALLLVSPTMIPTSVDAALRELSPRRIVVVGGTAAIDPAVTTSLESYGATVTRIGGSDRYDTAARLMADRATRRPMVITTGRQFADALAATPFALRNGAALLIVDGDVVPSVVQGRITALAPKSITVVGGVVAVSPTAELRVARLLPPTLPGRL